MSKALTLKLDRARWWAMQHSPFYGALAMHLRDVIGNPHGKTACTDGKRIYWDADFLEAKTDEEVRFLLLHETLHNSQGHFWRLPANDEDAQKAGDYAINLLLSESGLTIKMPPGGLLDKRWTGMAEEEILAALRREKVSPPPGGADGNKTKPGQGNAGTGRPQPGSGNPGSGDGPGDQAVPDPGGCGSFMPAGAAASPSPAEQAAATEALREHWEQAVIQAVQAAKLAGCGSIPGDLLRLVDKLTAPAKVDWRQETSDFLKNAAGGRNDWTRSPRRHAWQPVIYPRRKPDDVGLVIFCRDVSGSIQDTTLSEYSELIEQCTADVNCEALVLDCDTRITAEHRLAPGEHCPRNSTGGGGTDFSEPFMLAQKLVDEGTKVAGLVYLTDLDGVFPAEREFPFPVLWLATGTRLDAPFGRTVAI